MFNLGCTSILLNSRWTNVAKEKNHKHQKSKNMQVKQTRFRTKLRLFHEGPEGLKWLEKRVWLKEQKKSQKSSSKGHFSCPLLSWQKTRGGGGGVEFCNLKSISQPVDTVQFFAKEWCIFFKGVNHYRIKIIFTKCQLFIEEKASFFMQLLQPSYSSELRTKCQEMQQIYLCSFFRVSSGIDWFTGSSF